MGARRGARTNERPTNRERGAMSETIVAEHHRVSFAAASGFGLIDLAAASPLRIQLLPSGAVFAFRHGPTLINQLMPGPVDDSLFR